jgi:hypothetical protein
MCTDSNSVIEEVISLGRVRTRRTLRRQEARSNKDRLWRATKSFGPPMLNPNKRSHPSSDGSDDNDVYVNSNPIDKRRRIFEMEAVEDDIAPEQHVAWDKEVKMKFPNQKEDSMPDPSILLSIIIRYSSKMDEDYRDSERGEELLKRTHGLKEELEQAWGKGEFKRIRLLSSSRHLSSYRPTNSCLRSCRSSSA